MAEEEVDPFVLQDAYQRQPLLNSTSRQDSCSSDDDAGGANSSGYTRRKSKPPRDNRNNDVQIDIDADDEGDDGSEAPLDEVDRDGIPSEILKTVLVGPLSVRGNGRDAIGKARILCNATRPFPQAFVWLFFGGVATTTSLAMTHDRVPQIDPLPDTFLDNVKYQEWGLDASEVIIMVAMAVTLTLMIFHQHR